MKLLFVVLALAASFTGNDAAQMDVNNADLMGFGWEYYRECGGVLPLNTVYPTQFAYKEGENYYASEFCVWTLVPEENVQRVRVQVFGATAMDGQDGIKVYFWNGTDLTSKQIRHNETDVTFETAPVFLTFSSNRVSQSDGFRAIISAGGSAGNMRNRAYHVEKDEGEFTYPVGPSGREEYSLYGGHVSVVMQAVARNVLKMKKVRLQSLGGSDTDVITAYTLKGYFEYPDSLLRGRFPGNEPAEFVVDVWWPTVFFYTSSNNSNSSATGFSIKWSDFVHKIQI